MATFFRFNPATIADNSRSPFFALLSSVSSSSSVPFLSLGAAYFARGGVNLVSAVTSPIYPRSCHSLGFPEKWIFFLGRVTSWGAEGG